MCGIYFAYQIVDIVEQEKVAEDDLDSLPEEKSARTRQNCSCTQARSHLKERKQPTIPTVATPRIPTPSE